MKQSEVEKFQAPLVSIILLAFNHLDYTKLCVESLYRFTSHINFELITVNNGSSDDTEQFFNTLPNKKKINFPCNVGGDKASNEALKLVEGKYTVGLSNDLILTPNWLDNLLICIESDESIGIVVPACSASSNYQQVNLNYNNLDEMVQVAAAYNISNPNKWEERMRLITYTNLMRTELVKKLCGSNEIYSPGGFEDDDLSFRLRRAGYKLIFAKDTFVHHFGSITINDDYAKLNLLERNRRIFFNEFGVDAWDDCTIDFEVVNLIQCGPKDHQDVLILCASCGGTVLQVKNKLRENGCSDVTLWTMTEKQKYLQDLQTVSDYAVLGQFQNITAVCKDKLFDYILIEVDLQGIVNHQTLLQDTIKLLRDDGQLIFTAANEAFYLNVINLLNGNVDCDEKFSRCGFNIEKLCNFIANEGFADMQIYYPLVPIPPEHRPLFENLKNVSLVEDKKLLDQIYANRRAILSVKGKAQFKNVLFYPGYDYWLNDVVFSDNTIGNFLGVDTGKNGSAVLKEELEKHKFNLLTIDKGNIEQSEYIIFCDIPKSYNNPMFRLMYHQVYRGEQFFKEWLARGKGSKMVFILAESPFVMPENYDKSFHQHAEIVFTYLDDLVDNEKYFKYFYTQPLPFKNPYTTSYADKQMVTLIAGNKFSNVPGELYSERRKAIEYFESNLKEDFDLYGPGWETVGYTCYKGQVPGKLAVLSKYKYCICYENGASNGYITEKIFDCFFAGCVPIYLGAPNITDYIPANTFIDRRLFANYDEMYQYVNSIDENEYNTYLDNIHQFLYSEAFEKFTYANFAYRVAQVLEEKSFNNG
ncbi:MAG: hypothetical protein H6Q68_2330 [Firmicutes bacterium]|nr:hypothetical protein [Bacillota bacterium]